MSSLDKAADRARARDAGRTNGGEVTEQGLATREDAALALKGDAAQMITNDGHVVMAAKLRAGELDAAPQLATIEDGQTLHGILEGYGPPAEFTRVNKATGEVTTSIVDTWILKSATGTGARVSILSSAVLDRKLVGYVGCEVYITRLGHIETKSGNRVTEYIVAGPKLPDGSSRKWSSDTSPARELEKQRELLQAQEIAWQAQQRGRVS